MSPPANAPSNEPRPQWLAVRWRVALLLCAITTINYLDRQALAVAGPIIIGEFRLSNTEFGLINSAFLFAYAGGHLLAGPFIDRVGTKRAFTIAVIAWSLAGMLHAAGRSFLGFFMLRGLLGVTEAANFPAALKAVAEWFPRADRSLAVGIVTVGPGLGAVLAPPLLGGLILGFGWQAAFLVPGVLGFFWLWAWHAWYELPERHAAVSAGERSLILADRDEPASAQERSVILTHSDEPLTMKERRLIVGDRKEEAAASAGMLGYLRHRQTWGLVLSRFTNDGAFYFFVTWLPTYLVQARGFDLPQIAALAWVPFLAADIGSVAGGWAAKRLIAGGTSLDAARKRLIWVGALLIPLSLPAVTTDSAAVAIALIALAMFAIQFKAANLFALPVDLFPAREVGRIWGLFGAVGSFGGMAFVASAGWVSQHYSYEPIFWAVGVTQILSAVFVSWLIPRIEPLGPAGGQHSVSGAR